MATVSPNDLAEALRLLAADEALMWNVARAAVEDELIEFRDSGLNMGVGRSNGLVVRYEDGTPSDIIRFGPEYAIRIALEAIAASLDGQGSLSGNGIASLKDKA